MLPCLAYRQIYLRDVKAVYMNFGFYQFCKWDTK